MESCCRSEVDRRLALHRGKFQTRANQILIVLYLFLLRKRVSCVGRTVHDLHTTLLDNHNRNVVPQINTSIPITVTVRLMLFRIVDLNEKDEILSTKACLSSTWSDEHLIWDPKHYENVTKVYMKQKQVWLPDLLVYNSIHNNMDLGEDNLNVLIDSKGRVTWEPMLTLNTICEVNTRYFPFDVQNCSIKVLTWMHSTDAVELVLDEKSIQLNYYSPNGQWELTNTSAVHSINKEYFISILEFRIWLRRRSEYVIISVVVPVILISIINCFIYLLPPQSGERASFSITLFLANMVLMTYVTDSLPQNSRSMSIYVLYIMMMLGLAFLTVFISLISILLNQKSDDEKLSEDIAMDANGESYLNTSNSRKSKHVQGQSCSLIWKTIATMDLVLFTSVSVITAIITISVLCLLVHGQY